MDRRLLGPLLLFVALIAALVVPNIGAKAVAGSGSGGPVQRAPKVGDCVLEPVDTAKTPTFPTQRFLLSSPVVGSCQAAHYGEIAAVTANDAVLTAQLRRNGSDPNCTIAADKYLGLAVNSARLGLVPVQIGPWVPITGGTASIGPNLRQQSAGQNWVACVVAGSGPSALVRTGAYHGSVRNAFQGGMLPNSFGYCANSLIRSPTDQPGCNRPHKVQLFALGVEASWTETQVQLDTSCRQLLTRVTLMPDVTDGGKLKVQGAVILYAADGSAALVTPPLIADSDAETECAVSVAGARELTGTLFGLRRNPVPFGP